MIFHSHRMAAVTGPYSRRRPTDLSAPGRTYRRPTVGDIAYYQENVMRVACRVLTYCTHHRFVMF